MCILNIWLTLLFPCFLLLHGHIIDQMEKYTGFLPDHPPSHFISLHTAASMICLKRQIWPCDFLLKALPRLPIPYIRASYQIHFVHMCFKYSVKASLTFSPKAKTHWSIYIVSSSSHDIYRPHDWLLLAEMSLFIAHKVLWTLATCIMSPCIFNMIPWW